MKKCNMCGSQVADNYTSCPNCGSANLIADSVTNISGMPQQPMANGQQVKQSGNIGWGVLGFFFPIVGWILYFCWKNTRVGDAKYAGIGGIIGFLCNCALLVTGVVK